MSIRRAAAAAADLPQRSVHLRIVPRPANLSESREIFRLLRRFGELNTYYSLRYQYHNPADNVALAIYRSADAAQQALNASPLTFSLERETRLSDDPGSLDTVAADPGAGANLPPATSVDVSEMTSPGELLHRTTSSPCMITHCEGASGRVIFCNTSSQARRPISFEGCARVVSGGDTISASSLPSNPTTPISSGIRNPAC